MRRPTDAGDTYPGRDGTAVSLLRATDEAALFIPRGVDSNRVLDQVRAATSLNTVMPGPFATLPDGREVVVVRAIAVGNLPDTERLRGLPGILRVAPVLVDPATQGRMIPTDELILRLKPGIQAAAMKDSLGKEGVEVLKQVGTARLNTYLARINDPRAEVLPLARGLSTVPNIEWATPNFVREMKLDFVPNDPLFPKQQHLSNSGLQGSVSGADVSAVAAWDIATGDPNVVIAIVDTGADTSHPDLRISFNPGESGAGKESNGIDDDGNGFIDDYRGWDFSSGDNSPNPSGSNNHGTACAGVASARFNNATGVAGIAGGCRILPIKIFNDAGTATTDVVIGSAISYAAGLADIISNSWSGGAPSPFISAAIVDAVLNGRGGRGCPVFFSTGNSATLWKRYSFPIGSTLGGGTYSIGFRYQKDAAGSAGEDLVKFDDIVLRDADQFTLLPSALGPNDRQDFEGTFPPPGWALFSSNGANWTPTSSGAFKGTGGTQSVRSGAIGNNQWTELRTPKILFDGNDSLLAEVYLSTDASGGDNLVANVYSNGVLRAAFGPLSGVTSTATSVGYPASLPESIAVGASTDCDVRADYSQYGPELDFVGPSSGGWNAITTLDPAGSAGSNSSDSSSTFGGTSASCSLAAGVAALVLSINPALSASDVRQVLRATADKIGPIPYVDGFNTEYGYGRLNARAALEGALPSTVTLVASDPAAAEPSNTGVFTFSRTGSTVLPLTVHFTVSGTATAGADYASLPATITFAAGALSTNLNVVPIDDLLIEPSETLVLTLAADAAYALGSPSSATVSLADNDTPILSLVATDNTASEPGANTGRFTIYRAGSLRCSALSVHFSTGRLGNGGHRLRWPFPSPSPCRPG